MSKKLLPLIAIFSTLILTTCASNPTNSLVIQKENNMLEVTGLGKTQIPAKNNSISATNKACGSRSTPIVIDTAVL